MLYNFSNSPHNMMNLIFLLQKLRFHKYIKFSSYYQLYKGTTKLHELFSKFLWGQKQFYFSQPPIFGCNSRNQNFLIFYDN